MPRRYGLTDLELSCIAEVSVASVIHDRLCAVAASAIGEVCGALYGQTSGNVLQISHLQICTNRTTADSEFMLDLDSLYESARRPEVQAVRLVGIFHSHPDGTAVPSQFDCYYIERTPFVWAIIGCLPEGQSIIRYFLNQAGWVREVKALLHLER